MTNINDIKDPVYRDFRAGNVRHSQADVGKMQDGFRLCTTEFDVVQGIAKAMPWYVQFLK